MMTKFLNLCLLILGCSFILACANREITDGHENFKGFNKRVVGKLINDRLAGGNQKPLSIIKLENGNSEYRYQLNGNGRRPSCIEIYEVNPQTEIVVRSSYIGDEKGCVIVP